jgi:hypothetical protein
MRYGLAPLPPCVAQPDFPWRARSVRPAAHVSFLQPELSSGPRDCAPHYLAQRGFCESARPTFYLQRAGWDDADYPGLPEREPGSYQVPRIAVSQLARLADAGASASGEVSARVFGGELSGTVVVLGTFAPPVDTCSACLWRAAPAPGDRHADHPRVCGQLSYRWRYTPNVFRTR